MKLSTTPFYLRHETTGTKGQLATGEIEGIWGAFLWGYEL
jgi:hypothetical protein